MELDKESIDILSCDISTRPKEAAGVADLMPYLLSLKRDGNIVLVDFDCAAKELVHSFVRAEKLCCTGLEWRILDCEFNLRLTVEGTSAQANVVERWFEPL
jgi:hypothetical protein